MRTWYAARCSRAVLIVALVFNIEEFFQSSSNVVAGGNFDSGGFDQHTINQHLKRLQESLRWTRSPTPRARFRPWGGKRSSDFQVSPLRTPDYYQSLCSIPNLPFDLSLYSKCYGILPKRDKFRPWGGKRTAENKIHWRFLETQENEPSSFEDYNINEVQSTPYSSFTTFDRGMPETANIDRVNEQKGDEDLAGKYFNYFLGYPPEAEKIITLMARQDGNRIRMIKRQRFNPWGGKRSQRFHPWAGKRSQLHVFTINNPYNTLNKTNEDETQVDAQPENSLPLSSIYDSGEKLERKKREATSQNLRKLGNANVPKEEDDVAESEQRASPIKRSLKGLSRENTKRIGVLSDFLKEFESSIKGGPVQRGFHPWAGKKRSQREVGQGQQVNRSSRVPAVSTITSWDAENDKETEALHITKRNDDLRYTFTADKRQSFHPWAGKRNLQIRGNLLNLLDDPVLLGEGRTESKKAFNPWAGKRNVNDY